ncbi:MAG TPA: transporter substrate-binding domain-containing protein [Spirochaetia bacterium]|nr:transporter substrate-binding domain-containing protein [Spirochaetia bacterium]
MLKRILLVGVLLTTVLIAAGAQQTIKIGFWDNGPFVVGQPGGKPPVGAVVDYWTTIVAPAMNVKVEWVGPTPLLRLLSQLKSGDIDAVLIIGKNPERAQLFLYPSAPCVRFEPGIAVLKDNPLSVIKTQADLSGMRVGTAQGAVVSDFIKTANVTWDNVSTATWIQDDFAKLANKRIDAVFNLTLAGLQWEASQTYAGQFKFLALPVPPADIYTAFAKTDRGASFLKQYDPINTKKAGSLESLVKKYIQ